MKQEPTPLRRAACLLLAAAALPLAPLAAQETQPPADPPATAEPAPQPQAEAPAPVPTSPVVVETTSPPPAAEAAPEPAAAAPVARRAAPVRSVRRAPAPAPIVAEPVPAPVVVQTAPVAALPAPTTVVTTPAVPVATGPVETIPAAPTTGTDVVTVDDSQPRSAMPIWPWVLLLGLLALGGALLLAGRRRRATLVQDEVYEPEPVVAAPAPIVTPTPAVAERPRLELGMKPRRAGVAGEDARVEFELTVDNRGPVAAEDVRISTWMLASGSSEMERSLIEPRDAADTPPVRIAAGEARTLEAAVALPRAQVEGDAILPVVVADAHYRGPDGREEHTRVSYAVGVPDGEELMHFDVENPSGLHEGVVAQALGEPERA
ncbi:MAG: hypothetical protein JOZ90_06185 [Alphaproteobacteria bacterium]|nr:hypothetical protein [Alphaproteobacteria bacterium]MBV9372707.1 hypothetical protein [Alphaproteobacteria bacterium]MBV9900668.1 hypothetical protein [Alphaproteobacteria bacterium]